MRTVSSESLDMILDARSRHAPASALGQGPKKPQSRDKMSMLRTWATTSTPQSE